MLSDFTEVSSVSLTCSSLQSIPVSAGGGMPVSAEGGMSDSASGGEGVVLCRSGSV